MQCLAPLEPREPRSAAGASLNGLPWIMTGAAVGAAAGIAFLINWHAWVDILHRHALLQAELAICVGALPGFLLSRAQEKPLKRRPGAFARLFTEVGPAAAPVVGYTHYVPCALLARETPEGPGGVNYPSERPRTATTPGVLYAGPAGVRFEPRAMRTGHVRVDGSPIGGFDIGPVRMVSARSVALTRRGFERFVQRPTHAMLMQWPGGRALFAVPAIGHTLPRLHECLDTLRWGRGLKFDV